MIAYLALVAALGLCVALILPLVSPRADRVITRFAMVIFGDYVAANEDRRQRQRDLMRAAHVGGTHRAYAAKTLLFSGVLGVAGSVLGVYAVSGILTALEVGEDALRELLPDALEFLAAAAQVTASGPRQLFVLLLLASATVGVGLAGGTYYGRWEMLRQRAHNRATEIDATLPRTVAFMYALSRSGMPFPRVMDTLAENEDVYGEAATELAVAVRDMNTFGTDSLTALQRTANRTPSEDLADFAENLSSVLGTGQPVAAFLSDQYDQYQEEAEAKQQQYLELLSTFAEAYVTTLVAGPLFFITILVVIGLVLQDTLPLLRVVIYVAVPLATAGFVVYVDSTTQGVGGTDVVDRDRNTAEHTRISARRAETDGGQESNMPAATADRWVASRERLASYDRLRGVREWVAAPIERTLEAPAKVLLVSVPLTLIGLLLVVHPIEPGPAMRVIGQFEQPLVAGTAVVLGSYAVVYELRKRQIRAIESAVPDFLDRLASVNEAGTSVVGSVRRVADSNLERLTADLKRTRRDIEWGADVSTALVRLEGRVRSPMTSRAVALITNAMQASGDIGPVLRIAANEARATWALRRERRQVMVTYLIVIYISFFVFLGIIAALSVSFIPAIESATVPGTGGGETGGAVDDDLPGGGGIIGGIGSINAAAYEQLFFHATAVQAVCSGLVAGQLGEGSVKDGVKHAVVLLVLALATFAVIGAL